MTHLSPWLFAITLITSSALSTNSFAAEASPRIGAQVWTKLTADLAAEKADANFDVYRGFLTGDFTFDEQWSSHVIVDARTTKTALGAVHTGSDVSLFQALVRGKSLLTQSDVFQVGLAPGHYVVPLYKKLKTRHLGKTLSHYQGNFASRQLGVTYLTNVSNLRLGVQLHEANKTHGKKSEHNRGVSATLGYDVTDDLGVMASHAFAESSDGSAPTQNATALAIYSSNPDYRGALELSYKKVNGADSKPLGYGATVNIKAWDELRFFARAFTGNEAFQADIGGSMLWSMGPTLGITKGVSIGAVFDNKEPLEGAEGTRTFSLVLTANQ